MTTRTKLMMGALACLLAWGGSAIAKPYKSAEVFTYESMTYGKFVIRMRTAKGSGVISNFFLWKEGSELSDVFWEEVDIEVFGKNNATSWQSNIITGLGERAHSEAVHQQNHSFGDTYHTFAIEWTPDQVTWTVDGEVIRTTAAAQASELISPAQMRINFWNPNIVEWVGSWDPAVLPLFMYVNWVEYHSWDGVQFFLEWRDDFNELDTGRWGTADWTFAENRADFSPANAVVRDGYLVLALTQEGQEEYHGTPPIDTQESASSSSSSSSSSASSSSSSSGVTSSGSGGTRSGGTMSVVNILMIALFWLAISAGLPRARSWRV